MNRMKKICQSYQKFTSGFWGALLVLVCVGVITAAAVWSRKTESPYTVPDHLPTDEMSASALQQEHISFASAASSQPADVPDVWVSPLEKWVVAKPYSPYNMVSAGFGGLWQTHDGIDLQAEKGEPVACAKKGIVKDCGYNPLSGNWITIDFGDGWSARYSGLSMLSAIQKGDHISRGQTIGFAGEYLHGKQQPCIHMSLYHDNESVDPIICFEKGE